jgi:hypothetical protein
MMKKITFCFIAITFILTGCLDTVEELTIAQDGTGIYKSTMDMSGMFDMIEMMAAMDTSANSQLKKLSEKDIDSVLNMRSITDTASDLTEDQKNLFRDATMNITMKQKDKLFKMGMTYPFKKVEDVQKIMELNESGKGVGLFGKEGKSNAALPGAEEKGDVPSINKYYDMTIKNGLIERKASEEKLASLKNDDKLKDMKGVEDMMGAITFKTVIHLPKAATKAEGEKVALSADRTTVTIKSSLMDLFDNPKSLNFRVEY